MWNVIAALIGGAVALLAALVLAWTGRRRRVGDDPHCRRCDYNLTGATG